MNEEQNESLAGKMPVLFIGHGNPMYGIQENQYTKGWKNAVGNIPRPRAVLVISAHWETSGTRITAGPKPRTIHDFYGFPPELYEVRYDAPGDPRLASEVAGRLNPGPVWLDYQWGLDHGAWTVLRKLFPEADVPVLQMSLDRRKDPASHFEMAGDLDFLRRRGVLIIGSGNMVHNLRMIDFRDSQPQDWAVNANQRFKEMILAGEFDKLLHYDKLGKDVSLAVPTAEHFLPLLYALALKRGDDPVEIFNDGIDLGSISMTSLRIG
ncbi:MAG: 4,5-DOPA dioxygenase extradiol [Pyrinomonadaceae bacterium]